MRVALDATPLTLSSGGLRRYTEQLSLALTAQFPQDQFTLISDQPFIAPSVVRHAQSAPKGLDRRWWLAGANRAAARLDADLFHGTNFEVPLRRLQPAVVTIHDLSPWKQLRSNGPQWDRAASRIRRRASWIFRFKLATMVITPTEAIRREILSFFPIPPDRVVAVHHGGFPAQIPALASDPPSRPYFLFVGAVEPRKNLQALLEAWRSLPAGTDLVLAGRPRPDFPPIPPAPGLHILGEVPDRALPALYRHAIAFVYPSLYEGFGLPVLEAMEHGAPVIVSRDPALTEVAAEAAIPASGVAELAQAMQALLSNPHLAAVQREKSLGRAQAFSWSRAARETRAVYQEALSRA